ncbi:hypothetical protein AB4K20DRAFT_1278580 [Rhizopus microsporus]
MQMRRSKGVTLTIKQNTTSKIAQETVKYISMSYKKIRLVVVDYARLSTNPDHIRMFFSKDKHLKEIIIDEGHKISCISQCDIFNKSLCLKFSSKVVKSSVCKCLIWLLIVSVGEQDCMINASLTSQFIAKSRISRKWKCTSSTCCIFRPYTSCNMPLLYTDIDQYCYYYYYYYYCQ